MKKKLVSALLIGVMAVSMLAGCGGSDAGAGSGSDAGAGSGAAAGGTEAGGTVSYTHLTLPTKRIV